jgi:hypothetical protein
MFYYELHVFFSATDGYSIFVETEKDYTMNDDALILWCEENHKFEQGGDGGCVESIRMITKDEYATCVQSKFGTAG